MGEEREQALDKLAEGTRTLGKGLETEIKDGLNKAKGEGGGPRKRPRWKVWAR